MIEILRKALACWVACGLLSLVSGCEKPEDRLRVVFEGGIPPGLKVIKFVEESSKDYCLCWRVKFSSGELDALRMNMKPAGEPGYRRNVIGNLMSEKIPALPLTGRYSGDDAVEVLMLSETEAYILSYRSK